MSSYRHFRDTSILFAAVVLFLLPSSLGAQAMKKWIKPDGGIYFGLNPPPGSQEAGSVSSTSSGAGGSGESDAEGAWLVCTGYMRDRLHNPSTAAFPPYADRYVTYTGADQYAVSAYTDVAADENVQGRVRVDFDCTVRNSAKGWQLVNMSDTRGTLAPELIRALFR